MKGARYIARLSTTQPQSWNVLDTTRTNQWGEPWVEIPLITRDDAGRCAAALNAGRPPYSWLKETPPCRP